jgi:hypothetical protein
MESFSRGWSFLTQAWKMAFADKDLIKPTLYALVVGFIVTIIGLVPIALVAFVVGTEGIIAQIILGGMGLIMVFVQFTVTYLFSAMTIYLIYGYLSEGDGRMDKAWAMVQRDFWDILSLAAASTAVNFIQGLIRGKSGRGGGQSALRNGLANLIGTVWTEAAFLILPAMVIEDINLKDGLKRAGQITKNNLLLIGISTVGVKAVTGLIGFLLGLGGALLGFGVGYGLIALFGSSTAGLVIGIGLGVMIFFAFTLTASVIVSYTGTAYHTCLYLWARNVEQARATGQEGLRIAAPAPLAAVLGNL